MFEKQKAGGPETEDRVEISEELQNEFAQKHPKVNTENNKVKTLLAFANEQIRKQAQEIVRLQKLAPQEAIDESAPIDAQDE